MRKYSILFVALLLLSSCATSQERQARIDRFNATIPTCEGDADCKDKWSAAQVFIATRAGLKIQVATDAIIETYNPVGGNSSLLAAQVVKEPFGGGRFRIVISTGCKNPFGCSPDAWQTALDFNEYVGRINRR